MKKRQYILSGEMPVILKPAQPGPKGTIETTHIRFYIQERRIIQHIGTPDMQYIAVDLNQSDYGQADGIGPVRRPTGKNPSFLIIKKGFDFQFVSFGFMEYKQQINMRKTLQVGQPLGEFGINNDTSFGLAGKYRLNRSVFLFFPGGTNYPDRSKFKTSQTNPKILF